MSKLLSPNLALLLLLLPATTPRLLADSLVQTKKNATATVVGRKVSADKLHIRLSDTIKVVLSVEGAAPLDVQVNDLRPDDVWEVDKGKPRTSRLEDGRERWQVTWNIEPKQPHEHLLQLPALTYSANGGRRESITWKPVPVTVTTPIQKADANQLRDGPGIEELAPVPEGWWLTAAGGAGGGTVLLLAVAGFWLLRRRRLRPAAPQPPEDVALRELEQLRPWLPHTAAAIEPFHTRLDGIVRAYLERRWQLLVGRHTSTELVESLGEAMKLPEDQLSLLADFCRRCDLGKFAPLDLTTEECGHTLEMARTFVEQTAATLDNGAKKQEDLQIDKK